MCHAPANNAQRKGCGPCTLSAVAHNRFQVVAMWSRVQCPVLSTDSAQFKCGPCRIMPCASCLDWTVGRMARAAPTSAAGTRLCLAPAGPRGHPAGCMIQCIRLAHSGFRQALAQPYRHAMPCHAPKSAPQIGHTHCMSLEYSGLRQYCRYARYLQKAGSSK